MAFSQNDQGYLLWDLNLYAILGLLSIILAPDKLESRSGTQMIDSDYSLVSKKSKDLDDSLVSKNHLSHKNSTLFWLPGP